MADPRIQARFAQVLGFLNNLAFVQGMRPIYPFGGFVGTVGECTTNAW